MHDSHPRVCVLGLGYVGLPTASLLATKGMPVLGVDVQPETVRLINSGKIHIVEPDLDVMVRSAVGGGKLRAATTPDEADVFIIAVPTPCDHQTREPDLSYVESATRALAPCLRPGNLVILESTSPVGTTEQVSRWIAEQRPDLDVPASRGVPTADDGVFVAHCPERVLPGRVLRELVDNDRIIGGINPAATQRAALFYSRFVAGKILQTDCRTAELAKLSENTFRDVNIALANELSIICDRLGVDVWELIGLANRHPRVNILQPGPGVGGHCIAVDPWFIVSSSRDEARLIAMARQVNDDKPRFVIERVKERAARFTDPVVLCLGLTYKPNIDDLRESPAMGIVQQLAADKVARLLVCEPHVRELPESLTSLGVEAVDVQQGLLDADVVVLLVDHDAFLHLDRELLSQRVVIDTRGRLRDRRSVETLEPSTVAESLMKLAGSEARG
jgi:UDP-N-acetyl-D-mannosaminuronic acid dehydrogenase